MNVTYLQFPEDVQWVVNHVNGCKQALRRLEFGTNDTQRSWFYENLTPAQIIMPVVKKLHGMQDLSEIADWDLGKLTKYAPQGKSAPFRERQETFNEYFVHLDSPSIVNDPIWARAKKEAIRRLRLNQSGDPVSLEQVVQRGLSEDKYNTSSAYPDYGKRKDPKIRDQAIADAPTCIERRFPTTMGSRASMGKTGKDARHIFMGSMAVNIWGQRYQQPLQDYIRSLKLDFFLPWEGWEYVQDALSTNCTKTNLKFGADYTKMDQHFNKHHGFEVYDVVKHYFKPKYWDELHAIIQYVFDMPIITNLGYVDQEHCMPSGSEWTNFLETLWNFIFTIFLELKYHLKFTLRMGIGDDQCWLLEGNWTEKQIQWITDTVIEEFDNAGLPGNKDKQEVSVHKTGFLQRLITMIWNGYDGSVPAAGVYALIRNVTSQVFPEFFHNPKLWDASMFALRVIMIAENCVNHPLFKWYITEFVAKANKHILEFVRMSNDKLHEAEVRAKKIANFLPTYNQEKLGQSLLNFKTIKLLREVA